MLKTVVDLVLNEIEYIKYKQGQHKRGDRQFKLSYAYQHAYCSGYPDGGGGCDARNRIIIPEYNACTQETNAGNNIGSHPVAVVNYAQHIRANSKNGGTKTNE